MMPQEEWLCGANWRWTRIAKTYDSKDIICGLPDGHEGKHVYQATDHVTITWEAQELVGGAPRFGGL